MDSSSAAAVAPASRCSYPPTETESARRFVRPRIAAVASRSYAVALHCPAPIASGSPVLRIGSDDSRARSSSRPAKATHAGSSAAIQRPNRLSLKPAMNYTVALAIHPQLTTIERRLAAEQAALERLAAWAYQFSSTVIAGEISPDPSRARTSSVVAGNRRQPASCSAAFAIFIEHLEDESRTAGLHLSARYRADAGRCRFARARRHTRCHHDPAGACWRASATLPIARLMLAS